MEENITQRDAHAELSHHYPLSRTSRSEVGREDTALIKSMDNHF